MTPFSIKKMIEYLQKLESLLLLIQRDKFVNIQSLATNLGTSQEDISQRVNYLVEFNTKRLLNDIPNYSLDDAKQAIKVFKHYSQISLPSNAEEALNYGRAIAILLYAIRLELKAERTNLLIAQTAYENKLIRLKQEKIQQKELLKEKRFEAREQKLAAKKIKQARIKNLNKAAKSQKNIC